MKDHKKPLIFPPNHGASTVKGLQTIKTDHDIMSQTLTHNKKLHLTSIMSETILVVSSRNDVLFDLTGLNSLIMLQCHFLTVDELSST